MNQLTQIVQTSGLEEVEGKSIIERFGNYEALAKEWETKAKEIVVTDASQVIEIAMAKEVRKKFSNLRIEVERSRKAMKEQSLRKGQAIDAIARFLVSLITPIEEHLKMQENFIEIQEQKKIEEERIKAEKKAEQERLEREEAERVEQARIREENEKLRKEAEEKEIQIQREREEARMKQDAIREKARLAAQIKEKAMQAEREKAAAKRREIEEKARKQREAAQKKLDIEKEKREKIQAQLKAKRDEEARIKKEKADAEKAALKASDMEKYTKYIQELTNVSAPIVKDEEIKEKIKKIKEFFLRQL